METKTYKIVKGYYQSTQTEELKLPLGVKLLYDDGDIGMGCHVGHNHYMGMLKRSDYNEEELEEFLNDNIHILPYDFSEDYVLFVIRDIKFIDKVPTYKTSEEFMTEFGLRDYYIMYKKPDLIENRFYDDIKIGMEFDINKFEKYIIPGKIFSVIKIININGPFNVSVFNVFNGDRLGNENYGMHREDYIDIIDIIQDITDKTKVIISKDGKEHFERIKNEVLMQIDSFE